MSSFILENQKGLLEAQLANIHDTFGRDIVIFKQGQQITISTNPKHDMIWESSPQNDVVQIIPVSGVFKARIKYATDQQRQQMATSVDGKGADQLGIQMEVGDVRLKLDPTGAAFIQSATEVILDGDVFTVQTPKRPHGLFNPQFYDFILKRAN